jgi:AcrR family transcriptional regulator
VASRAVTARPLGRRPSGGPDTRETILDAARELFAENGFERTTLRSVAVRADVDQALIAHYFTNKDGLLEAALAFPVDPAVVLSGIELHRDTAGSEILRRLLTVWETQPQVRTRMVATLRAGLSHPHAAAQLREVLGRTVLAVVRDLVEPDQRELRAALIGSHLGGLMLGRYVLEVPGIAEASTDEVVAAMGPALQHYITGPVSPSRAAPAPAAPTRRPR